MLSVKTSTLVTAGLQRRQAGASSLDSVAVIGAQGHKFESIAVPNAIAHDGAEVQSV